MVVCFIIIYLQKRVGWSRPMMHEQESKSQGRTEMNHAKRALAVSIAVFVFVGLHLVTETAGAEAKYDGSKYHNYNEVTNYLRSIERSYRNTARLISAGKSHGGKDIWVLEISGRDGVDPRQKPGIAVFGGLRGDEVVGTEAALYAIDYLLDRYQNDNRIKTLIDTKTFYIWPMANPDACDRTVRQPGKPSVRNLRPLDEDGDGMIDEDPAEDLNRDGYITLMRVEDEDGDFKKNEKDERMLVRVDRSKGETGQYRVYTEGKDDDGDGSYNEDGEGGVDLDRNFPSGWKMAFEQPGAGMYPGSAPESEAILQFLTDHANVSAVLTFGAGKGVLFRPFDHLADKEVPKIDLEIYNLLGKKYKDITGRAMVHAFPEEGQGNARTGAARTRAAGRSAAQAPSRGQQSQAAERSGFKGKARYGTLLDWAYKDFNVYALRPSLSTVPVDVESGLPGETSWRSHMETAWEGKGFVDWQAFQHPQLGDVEIGGCCSFYVKNPPPGDALMALCEEQARFILDMAGMTPAVRIHEVSITPLQILRDPTMASAQTSSRGQISISKHNTPITGSALLAEVKVRVENAGPIGTRTALGKETRYAQQQLRSVLATLEAVNKNIEILSMPRVLRLGVIEGTETTGAVKEEEIKQRAQEQSGDEDADEDQPHLKTGKWLIKMNGPGELIIRVVSEKGGTVEKRIPVRF